jgi:hypothetical protein
MANVNPIVPIVSAPADLTGSNEKGSASKEIVAFPQYFQSFNESKSENQSLSERDISVSAEPPKLILKKSNSLGEPGIILTLKNKEECELLDPELIRACKSIESILYLLGIIKKELEQEHKKIEEFSKHMDGIGNIVPKEMFLKIILTPLPLDLVYLNNMKMNLWKWYFFIADFQDIISPMGDYLIEKHSNIEYFNFFRSFLLAANIHQDELTNKKVEETVLKIYQHFYHLNKLRVESSLLLLDYYSKTSLEKLSPKFKEIINSTIDESVKEKYFKWMKKHISKVTLMDLYRFKDIYRSLLKNFLEEKLSQGSLRLVLQCLINLEKRLKNPDPASTLEYVNRLNKIIGDSQAFDVRIFRKCSDAYIKQHFAKLNREFHEYLKSQIKKPLTSGYTNPLYGFSEELNLYFALRNSTKQPFSASQKQSLGKSSLSSEPLKEIADYLNDQKNVLKSSKESAQDVLKVCYYNYRANNVFDFKQIIDDPDAYVTKKDPRFQILPKDDAASTELLPAVEKLRRLCYLPITNDITLIHHLIREGFSALELSKVTEKQDRELTSKVTTQLSTLVNALVFYVTQSLCQPDPKKRVEVFNLWFIVREQLFDYYKDFQMTLVIHTALTGTVGGCFKSTRSNLYKKYPHWTTGEAKGDDYFNSLFLTANGCGAYKKKFREIREQLANIQASDANKSTATVVKTPVTRMSKQNGAAISPNKAPGNKEVKILIGSHELGTEIEKEFTKMKISFWGSSYFQSAITNSFPLAEALKDQYKPKDLSVSVMNLNKWLKVLIEMGQDEPVASFPTEKKFRTNLTLELLSCFTFNIEAFEEEYFRKAKELDNAKKH